MPDSHTQTLRSKMRGEGVGPTERVTPWPDVTDLSSPPSTQSGLQRTRQLTRLEGQSPTIFEPVLRAWTEKNPDWDKEWRIPLAYSRTVVDKNDIPRLNENEFLNDNLINFYLQYLRDKLEKENPAVAKRVYFHNSFFYEKLKPTKGRIINYDGVKKWTAKVDLLAYDYIVVPVNENLHWWVAIICNAPKLLDRTAETETCHEETIRAEQRDGSGKLLPMHYEIEDSDDDVVATPDPASGTKQTTTKTPRQSPQAASMTVDLGQMSLEIQETPELISSIEVRTSPANSAHSGDDDDVEEIFSDNLLRKRVKAKRGPPPRKHDPKSLRIVTLDSLDTSHSQTVNHLKQYLIAEIKEKKEVDLEDPGSLGMTAKHIPLQWNHCDCGVFLLGYVQEFVKDPDAFIAGILLKEMPIWGVDAPALRNDLRALILKLQSQYQLHEEKKRKTRAENRRLKAAEGAQGTAREAVNFRATPSSASPPPADLPGGTPSDNQSAALGRYPPSSQSHSPDMPTAGKPDPSATTTVERDDVERPFETLQRGSSSTELAKLRVTEQLH